MYTLSETQIEFILDDIRRRGIETEDLQSNLLDHICCIIESELEENGDFGQFYQSVIPRFYRRELREVELETQSLLMFKNYYSMKKIMFAGGTASAIFTALGIFFKFMHWPMSAFLIFSGIVLFSLFFLPMLLILRVRERKDTKERILTVTGVISGMLLSLGVLFKVNHWPLANIMGFSAVLLFALLFLPMYYFLGIRKPENRETVIINSLIILIGCGLFLTMVSTSRYQRQLQADRTRDFLQQERILDQERKLSVIDSARTLVGESKSIDAMCDNLKKKILHLETGLDILPYDAVDRDLLISESIITDIFDNGSKEREELSTLRSALLSYNQKLTPEMSPLPDNLDSKELRSSNALQGLVRIQLSLLQNSRVR